MIESFYKILEIDVDADTQKIKSAYRRLARKFHPDVNPDNPIAIEKFKKITEAYETLSDQMKRTRYDLNNGFTSSKNTQTRRTQANKAYSEQKTAQSQESSTYRHTYRTAEKNAFNEIFNDILTGIKKSAKKQKKQINPAVNGSDITMSLIVTTLEAFEGTTRTVNILHTEICPKCKGRKFINEMKCPLCQAKGITTVQKKINIKIPAMIKNGSKIRIANEGNQGQNGGLNGDLYLKVEIEENSKFTFKNNAVFSEIEITPFEAALGATIEVETPNNKKVAMKIPPCTSSGQKFKLSGQGLKTSKNAGDLIITVQIKFPKTLTPEEKELYEKIKNITNKNKDKLYQ